MSLKQEVQAEIRKELESTSLAMKIAVLTNIVALVRDTVFIVGMVLFLNTMINRVETKIDETKAEISLTITETVDKAGAKFDELKQGAADKATSVKERWEDFKGKATDKEQ